MKTFSRFLIGTSPLSGVAVLLLTSSNAHAEDLKVIRTMISITCARFGNYWPNPKAKEPSYNTWSWLPRTNFYLKGDMAPGSEVSIEYLSSDGKPWLTVPLPANRIGESNYYAFGNDYSTQEAGKPAKILVGTFPFKIRLKNALEGTNKVLYYGKYKVSKFHKGNALPAFKNQFEYVVDQDWRMNMAYLSPDLNSSSADAPMLQIRVYMKGQVKQERLEGVLYHEGKIIGTKELRGGTTNNPFSLTTSGMDTNDPIWQQWTFAWGAIRMHPSEQGGVAEQWYLTEHPGAYELKVLRNGQLARSVKFNVDASGKILDKGFGAAANAEGTFIVPSKVLGTTDGKWNPLAWKTDAFYANPLTGFVG
ncbi:hypothetical protein EON83_27255 [bacterium]|nr:MAG: hypothetical protein EON83_27255 [bacterium]